MWLNISGFGFLKITYAIIEVLKIIIFQDWQPAMHEILSSSEIAWHW